MANAVMMSHNIYDSASSKGIVCMGLVFSLSAAGSLLILCSTSTLVRAEESHLELLLGAKAGSYQTSGNLFAEKNLSGWGVTLKLIPENFGSAARDDDSWLGGTGFMMSIDFDNFRGQVKKTASFPFVPGEELELAWSVLAIYGCALTQYTAQICLGLPVSNALAVQQNLAGETWNSFTMGNDNLPVFLAAISHHKPLNFGGQISSSYWNPTYAGVKTHFNLIQSQVFLGYAF